MKIYLLLIFIMGLLIFASLYTLMVSHYSPLTDYAISILDGELVGEDH